MQAEDLNFFAWRLRFQLDPRDERGLQQRVRASLEVERNRPGLKVVRGKKR